ncbi:MAG: hypothetical protein IPH95_18295 [Candidatus Promineofilum sp.]|nr:hypothetical protein [Promineifilum sp.]
MSRWKTMPMGAAEARGSSPISRTAPADGRSNPPMTRSSVDLPTPDEPTRATNAPAGMVSETRARTWSRHCRRRPGPRRAGSGSHRP